MTGLGTTSAAGQPRGSVAAANPIIQLVRDYGGIAFSIGGLILMSDGAHYVLGRDQYGIESARQGNPLMQALAGLVFLIAGLRLALDPRGLLKVCRGNTALFAFVLFAMASVLWSPVPDLALRRVAAFAGTTLFGVFLAVYYRPDALFRLVASALGIVVLLQLIGIPLVMGHAFGTQGLRGLMDHKNDFGRLMALAAITFWYFRSTRSLRGLAAWGAFLTSTALAFGSGSRTAWLQLSFALSIAYPLTCLLKAAQLTASLRTLSVSMLLGLALLLGTSLYVQGLEAIGKDATLTNRTIIWQLLFPVGMKNVWLGVGYGSFWDGPYSELFRKSWSGAGHAHNGYLDLWLTLGTVGLILLFSLLIAFLGRAIRGVMTSGGEIYSYSVLVLSMIVIGNVVAPLVPDHNSITWVIMVALTLTLKQAPQYKPVGS